VKDSQSLLWRPALPAGGHGIHRGLLEPGLERSERPLPAAASQSVVKNIPGRKTDQKDAEWIADLLAHGLLRTSFVPPPAIEELRDWTRYRVKLTQSEDPPGEV
jgi:hypothetical protein